MFSGASRLTSLSCMMRVNGRRVLVDLALVVVLASSCVAWAEGSSFGDALKAYRSNTLEKAKPLFEEAIKEDGKNADAYAYLAEILRRSGDMEGAVSFARKAISISPCHSFAYTVLANAYYPMFGIWDGADEDSSWKYLRKATDCDSMDGNAWTGMWVEAMRRGETELEKRALRSFFSCGFFASPLLSYNRWVLENLPRNAVLFTNGDMDTYPVLALQEVDNLRPDVCVINLSLLNLPWYARLACNRCGLPLPFKDDELDGLRAYQAEDGSVVTNSNQIVASWLKMQEEGRFPRQIAMAATVSNLDFTPESRSRMKLAGPFYLCYRKPVDEEQDPAMMRTALGRIKLDDYRGPWVSPVDRSPVRIMGTDRIASNITALAVHYGYLLLKAGKSSEALKWADWAAEFEKNTTAGPIMADKIGKLKKEIEGKSK